MPIIKFENRDRSNRNNKIVKPNEIKSRATNQRIARKSSNFYIKLNGSFKLSRQPTYCRSLYITNIGYDMLVSDTKSSTERVAADPRNQNLPDGLKFTYKWKVGYDGIPAYGIPASFEDIGGVGHIGNVQLPNNYRLAWYHMQKLFPSQANLPSGERKPKLGVEISIVDMNGVILDTRLLDLGIIQDPGYSMNTCLITKQVVPTNGDDDQDGIDMTYSSVAASCERGNALIARSDHWPRRPEPVDIEYVWYRKDEGMSDFVPLLEGIDPDSFNYYPWIFPYNNNPENAGEGANQAIVIPETLFPDSTVFKVESVLTVPSDDPTEGFTETNGGSSRRRTQIRASSDAAGEDTKDESIFSGYSRNATWIDGYYPVYLEKKYSDKASPEKSSHTHVFDGVTYYMPNGVPFVHNYKNSGNKFVPKKVEVSPPQSRDIFDDFDTSLSYNNTEPIDQELRPDDTPESNERDPIQRRTNQNNIILRDPSPPSTRTSTPPPPPPPSSGSSYSGGY